MRANFICIGENHDRILLTTLENQEASDSRPNTGGELNTTAPAVMKRDVAE
jgi:hypothetical protein